MLLRSYFSRFCSFSALQPRPVTYDLFRGLPLNHLIIRTMTTTPPNKEYTKIEIDEKDLEWQQVRGSGPGGQATNKTNNCIILKHKPSGIVVKCHSSRDTITNKHLAIKSLKEKLDIMINGDMSKRMRKIDKAKKQKDRRRRKSEEKHGSKDNKINTENNEMKSDNNDTP